MNLPNGTSLISTFAPQSVGLDVLGFPAVNGDTFQTYNAATQAYGDTFDYVEGYGWYDSNSSTNPVAPVPVVGSSFWINSVASTWTQPLSLTNPIWPQIFSTNAPTVSLTSPTNGNSFASSASITLTANASSALGIARVDFFQQGTLGLPDPEGDVLLGSATSTPYSITWTGAPVGTNSIIAQAMDNTGNTTVSTVVTITVSP